MVNLVCGKKTCAIIADAIINSDIDGYKQQRNPYKKYRLARSQNYTRDKMPMLNLTSVQAKYKMHPPCIVQIIKVKVLESM